MELLFNRSLQHFFANLPLFRELPTAELTEILRLSQPFSRNAGEALFREGDPADGVYVIERGEVAVMTRSSSGHPVTLAYLGNGAVVGEMALIAGEPRSATVEVVSQTNGYWIARHRFNELRDAWHPAAYRLLWACAGMLEERRRTAESRIQTIVADPERAARLQERSVRELLAQVVKG